VAPLDGVKVIELARILAGSWAGQTLAGLGAQVIKIEAPQGDDTRNWGPPFIERDGDKSAAYFHSCNRGKSSVVIDFRTPEGQAQLRDLVTDADVLIENFKVGGLAKYGLDGVPGVRSPMRFSGAEMAMHRGAPKLGDG
jgi:crotonobetainyl-CoA:carnitine CoA-transferase CaiB-like acyl-CoA transferase